MEVHAKTLIRLKQENLLFLWYFCEL